MKTVLALAFLLSLPSGAAAQSSAPAAANPPTQDSAQDPGWPRQFGTDECMVTIFTPQVESWQDFAQIEFRAAISVAMGSGDPVYGTIHARAASQVSVADRLVLLTGRQIEDVNFPGADPDAADRMRAGVLNALPSAAPMTISLDRIVSQMDASQIPVRKVDVNLAPPRIFTSDRTAILVVLLGKSRFKPVPGGDAAGLLFAINTNWDLFFDATAAQYYLLDGKSWLTTGDLEKGPWTAATALPAGLSNLPANANWSDVLAAIPPGPVLEVPAVFVSHEPAELVATKGAPEYQPIDGTKLMLVSNTESDLFFDATDEQYYLLAAGRWFKAAALAGPWSASSTTLPQDFQKIPAGTDTSDVLASVPGTTAAKEAMVLASIPEKAQVNRSDVHVAPTYDGDPQWKTIDPTGVQYAYNSPYDVFLVEGSYYCCHDGIWFAAPTPTGEWAVAEAIPDAIYTIPPTSPLYNVTYVRIYESTPTVVVMGYTSGYCGATVATTGVVMFGLGLFAGAAWWADDCCWGYHYPACAFSYGCGAYYHGAYGGYVCAGHCYGPYGGAGGFAAYNPATGVYSRGAYAYGPRGAAGYRAAYDPRTGTAAYRAGGRSVYGSWGRGAVSNGDQWVRGGHTTTASGSRAAVAGSGGGAIAHAQSWAGNGATVARTRDGDLYAGADGNVYRRTSDGWEQAQRPESDGLRNVSPGASPAAWNPPQAAGNLDGDWAARQSGDWNSMRSQSFGGFGGGGYSPVGGGWARGGRRR